MRNRGIVLTAVLAVCGVGMFGLAGTASAAQLTIEPGSAPCSAVLNVVPGPIRLVGGRQGPLYEGGTVTEVGSCEPGATGPVLATGTWDRYGGSQDVFGRCPSAELWLTDARTGRFEHDYEITQESSAASSAEIFGVNPDYFAIPFGYGAIVVPAPVGGFFVAQTDQVACAAWPTTLSDAPAPPPFRIEIDGPRSPTSLLHACLTVTGVLPRACFAI